MTHAPNSLAGRDLAYSLHPYTNLAVHEERGPFIITRGEGIYVYDDQDNQYIEGLAGLWCTGLGFSEKRLADAAKSQLDQLPFSHSFAHRATIPVIELSEKLIDIAPGDLGKVYLVNSGSEAVDTAIKMVWYYHNAIGKTEKKKIISRKRAYHGVTIAAGSLTALPYAQDGWDLPLERFIHTDTPCYYRYGEDGESEEDFATRLADNLDRQIQAEGPDTVGALIAEPVMGAGGVMVPPKTYFEKIQKVLKKHDVLLIADEVICGFGRTGEMWGCDTYGIKPDLLTCAKQLSSAYLPIGAVMVTNKLYEAFVDNSRKLGIFGTGNTYGGHPVAAAVALETLKIYQDDDIMGHVKSVTPHFQERLKDLGKHPLVGEARGVGLIGGLELVANKETKEQYPPATKAAPTTAEKILGHKLVIRPLPGDGIGICPPLIVTDAEIDDIFDRLKRGLDDAQAALG
ncbi:MAG: aspartate aminotransferase family protein [Rhodospirillales bacterium]|nr:aspartate aminotransferase family protein [Rhodospirillales bacterium]